MGSDRAWGRWLVAGLLLVGCSSSARVPWDPDGVPTPTPTPNPGASTHRLSIDVSNGDVVGTHNSFPMYVQVRHAGLRSTANGGNVAHAEGADLFFTDLKGAPRSHEVVFYDPASGDLEAWVGMPVISSNGGNDLYLYYGDASATESTANPAGVWLGFDAVWHLDEEVSDGGNADDVFRDATGKATAGHHRGTQSTSGRIGGAQEFTPGDTIDFGDTFNLDGSEPFTLTAWVSTGSGGNMFLSRRSGPDPANEGYNFGFKGGELIFSVSDGTSELEVYGPGGLFGDWYHVMATWDPSSDNDTLVFVDGYVETYNKIGTHASVAAGGFENQQPFRLGQDGSGGLQFTGLLDEVRVIVGTAKDENWFHTMHHAMNGSFTRAENEEAL